MAARRRAFFDKRLAQEVDGEALGEVKPCTRSMLACGLWLSVCRQSFCNFSSNVSLLLQEYKGYIFKIMGGQDKQGFGMKQGVLVPGRVALLMTPGDSCFRGFGRRKGERRRKSVRGCIVSQDLSVLNLVIVKKGERSDEAHAIWLPSVVQMMCDANTNRSLHARR